MMSEENFVIVGEEYVGYMQGNAYIISNGECKFSLWERKEDAQKVCDYLNEQQAKLRIENKQLKQKVNFYKYFQKEARELEKENEKLQKQIQNYNQLIANSYVGEETLDGWLGKYVIFEDELQKYKNKNEMIDNE